MSEREPSLLKGEPKEDAGDDAALEGGGDAEAVQADGDADAEDVQADGDAEAEAEADAEADADVDADAEAEADVDAPPSVEAPKKPAAEPAPSPAIEAPIKRPVPLKRRGAPTYHVAGFWKRFAAGMIDLAIILPVGLVLAWIAGAIAGVHLPPSRHRGIDFWLDLFLATDPALVGMLGLILAIGIVYALVFQITIGHTLGMRVLKIRIIDVYGEPPSTGRSVARTAGYLGCMATLTLGFLWIGFDAEKRGLHDWVSGTYVIKT